MGSMIQWKTVFLLFILALIPMTTIAATSNVRVEVKVLVPPPCTIDTFSITMSNIITTKIDGNNYKAPLELSNHVVCQGEFKNSLKLRVTGTNTGFDKNALYTGIEGLGIALLDGNKRILLGEWIDVSYPDLPNIDVVPVKHNLADTAGGHFVANAILQIDYR